MGRRHSHWLFLCPQRAKRTAVAASHSHCASHSHLA
jgi:hypothetical protein